MNAFLISGDLSNEDEVLKYLLDRQSRDEIEDVSSKALEPMIEKTEQLVVLFCKFSFKH